MGDDKVSDENRLARRALLQPRDAGMVSSLNRKLCMWDDCEYGKWCRHPTAPRSMVKKQSERQCTSEIAYCAFYSISLKKKQKNRPDASCHFNWQQTTHIVWLTATKKKKKCVNAYKRQAELGSWRRRSNLAALGHPSGMSWPCLNGVAMSHVKAFTPEGLGGQLMQNCQRCHGCSRKYSLLLGQTAKLSVKSTHRM